MPSRSRPRPPRRPDADPAYPPARMATSWQGVFELPDGAAPAGDAVEEPPEEERRGLFRRLRENLTKSRHALADELTASLGDSFDSETWERLEEALILADVGARPTDDVVGRVEAG